MIGWCFVDTDTNTNFTIELSKSEYHLYTTLCLKQSIRNIIFYVVVFNILSFIRSLFLMNDQALELLKMYVFYSAIVIIAIIAYKVIRVKSGIDKDYLTDKISKLPLTYSFFDDYFLLQNDIVNEKIPLSYIYKVLLNKEGIILLLSRSKALVIPKRALDNDNYNKLVEYFKEKVH